MGVLDENVVTGASQTAELASAAPALSSTITAEQLERLGIQRLEDAINYLSLGMFAHDRMSTPEIGARGVALTRDMNSHVLVLVDGMVMNEQGGGAAFLHDVPMEAIDHIEIILGPGSVLYGAQAMLGVINVVMKSPEAYEGLHVRTVGGASAPLRASGGLDTFTLDGLGKDNRYSVGLGRRFEWLGVPMGLLATVDYTDFDGPDFSFARQPVREGTDGNPLHNYGAHAEPGFWGGPVERQWFQRTAGLYTRLEAGSVSWSTRATLTRSAAPQLDLFENRAPAAYDDPHN